MLAIDWEFFWLFLSSRNFVLAQFVPPKEHFVRNMFSTVLSYKFSFLQAWQWTFSANKRTF